MDRLKFDTKKDWFGTTLLLGPTLIISILTLLSWTEIISLNKILPKKPLLIATGSFWIFFILTWKFTYYTIDETTLTARMALFRWKTIKIHDIKEIKNQKFGLWTFGLSKDVLSIKLKSGRELNISPSQPNEIIREIEKRKTISQKTYG